MHEIIRKLLPKSINKYKPTHNIILNIQNMYDFNPLSTLFILKNFSKFKKEFNFLLIEKLKEIEKFKNINEYKYIKDYYLIKDNKEVNKSIYNYTSVIFEIVNIPIFLYYNPIKDFNKRFFNENDYIIKEGKILLINRNSILCSFGYLINEKIEKILRFKLFICNNNQCIKKSKFIITFKGIKSSIYFIENTFYYLINNFKYKCLNCNIKLIEDIKNRNIEFKYFYLIYNNLSSFSCYSFKPISGNLHLGSIKRNKLGSLVFKIYSSSNTLLQIECLLKNKSRILSNFQYFEKYPEILIKKYVKMHISFLEKISNIEISLIIILHLHLLFDSSIAIFTDDCYFISLIAKHFFNIYGINISILFEAENKRGLYIFDLRYFSLKNKYEDFINKIDFRFILKINKTEKKMNVSFSKQIINFEFVILYSELDFKNELKNLTHKFFKKDISTERIIKTLLSLHLIFKNIFKGYFNDKILNLIEIYFKGIIL